MNTPSKEALEAASEAAAAFSITPEELAAIIDRHFSPLRQRAEQAEQKARDWETAANLYQLDFQTEAARAEQAEARVGELEFGLKHQCETCEMKSIFDGEHDLAVKAQTRVKELEAENENAAEAYKLLSRRIFYAEQDKRQSAEQRNAEQEATIAELTTDGNAVTLAANLAKVSKRVADLQQQLDNLTASVNNNGK